LPSASTARTENVCGPAASSGVRYGATHASNGASSRLHSKVAPTSEEKSNVATVPSTASVTIAVSGGTVSPCE
jgi:hypothetical protein